MPTIRERGGRHQALVRIKQGGVVIHKETKTFDSHALAQSWGERVEARIKKEGVPARRLENITFGALLRDHLAELQKHRAIGLSQIGHLTMLATYFDGVKLAAMTSTTFTAFARKRREEGAGASTVNHNMSVLRSVLNSAKAMFGFDIDGKPVAEAMDALARMGTIASSTQRDRRPTADELARLVAEFERIKLHPATEIPMHIVVPLAVAFPRRIGEMCKMKWEDYNSRKSLIVLHDTKDPVKPRKETIPVTPEAKRIIDALPRISDRILPYESRSMSASFQRACARLGIDDLHFHDLRHEGITRLFERGLAIQEVCLFSGHVKWDTLKRYTHLKAEDLATKLSGGNADT